MNTKPDLFTDCLVGFLLLMLLGILDRQGVFTFHSMLPYVLITGYFTIRQGAIVACVVSIPIAVVAIPMKFIVNYSQDTVMWELIWTYCKLAGVSLGIHIGQRLSVNKQNQTNLY